MSKHSLREHLSMHDTLLRPDHEVTHDRPWRVSVACAQGVRNIIKIPIGTAVWASVVAGMKGAIFSTSGSVGCLLR